VAERRARVLIADSDAVTRHLIAASLLLAGFDAVPVADARECLDELAAAVPDAVVLRMATWPPEAWRAAIDSLQRSGGRLVRVVLIIPAGQAGVASRDPCLRADACLTTPFDLSEMIRVVRELIGHQSGQLG
jgi:DNA-binding NtrC family response regulator